MIWKAVECAVMIVGWIMAEEWEVQHKKSIPAVLGMSVSVWVIVWTILK